MIKEIDVCAALKEMCDTDGLSASQLLPACKSGLDWVRRHLKENVNEDDAVVIKTAASMARFFLFVKRLSSPDDYASLKVGDMTVARDLQKEYEIEKQLKTAALIEAADILKDGGFYFGAN